MKDHYDDKLADKFRQELEGYEVAFDPVDWKAMQQRLPGQDKIRRRIALILGGVSVVAASLFVAMYLVPQRTSLPADQQTAQSQPSTQQVSGAKQSSSSPAATGAETPATVSAESSVAQSSAGSFAIPTDPAATTVSGQETVASLPAKKSPSQYKPKPGKQASVASVSRKDRKSSTSADGNQPVIAHHEKGSSGRDIANNNPALTENNAVENPAARLSTPSLPEEEKIDMALLTPLQPGLVVNSENTGIKTPSPAAIAARSHARGGGMKVQSLSDCPSPKFKLGLAVLPAADLVTYHHKVIEVTYPAPGVEIQQTVRKPTNMTALNLGVGLLGDVVFNKRWSIGTGVFLSQQHLKFEGSRLLFVEQESIDASRDPNVVSAEKFMEQMTRTTVNVPLQVRYNLVSNCKNQAFVSLGLSNYVYVQESYLYQKEKKYLPIDFLPIGTVQTEPEDYTSTQFASTVNISGGIERKLGRRFSLQAEPFLRLPIQRSGHEKLNIRTGGVIFRLNYNFM